jgi:outer membrane protein TolC
LLEKINLKKELATQGFKAERAKFLPTLAATGMYDLYNKDLSPYVPDYMVGIVCNGDFFGASRYNK